MKIPDGMVREIMDDLAPLSGLVLFRVTGTWAHNGRSGTIDEVILAGDMIQAISRAWATEDNRDLRTIHAEWLSPVELIKEVESSDDRPTIP